MRRKGEKEPSGGVVYAQQRELVLKEEFSGLFKVIEGEAKVY